MGDYLSLGITEMGAKKNPGDTKRKSILSRSNIKYKCREL
jgi:hypothetical protein